MEHTVCSQTLVRKIQMPENHPDERIQHSEHSESLKSSIVMNIYSLTIYLVFVSVVLVFYIT